jgi:hypothetical protein
MPGTKHSKFDLDRTDSLEVNGGMTRRLGLKIAKVTSVDPEKNLMSVEWLWPYGGGVGAMEIGCPYVGPKSGIRVTPEVGSVLVVGYSKDKIVPLSYLMPGSFEALLSSEKDGSGDRSYSKVLNPGDMQFRSSRGADVRLEEQAIISTKNGDTITINPNTGDIILDSLNLNVITEAGTIRMGQIVRAAVDGFKVITDDGLDVTEINGGNALNELKISIQELSDSSILNPTKNETIAEVTLGTLVSNNGKKLVNQDGNQIVCDIKFSTGARIQVDKKGKININEGNMLKPTDPPAAINGALESLQSQYSYQNISQQRAAREGDRVTMPLVQIAPNIDHPQLINKSIANLAPMQQLAGMFYTVYGPCTFIPTGEVKMVGEITQGADGVFIGSFDKMAEIQENQKN